MTETSNIGKTGVSSIRVGGRDINSLPIAEAALTKQQWPDILKSSHDNAVTNIKAKYPKQTIAWINGAIRECEDSIKRVRQLSVNQQKMIDDYLGHISLCEYRDKEIHRIESNNRKKKETVNKEIKDLKLRFPPYNVEAMRTQITQCKEAISRVNEVVDKEHNSISELRELLVKCINRDNELRAIGETV